MLKGRHNSLAHIMNWIGIMTKFHPKEGELVRHGCKILETIMGIDLDKLEGAINYKFNEKILLVEAITHASPPPSIVSLYHRLEFVWDATLVHLITIHLLFT